MVIGGGRGVRLTRLALVLLILLSLYLLRDKWLPVEYHTARARLGDTTGQQELDEQIYKNDGQQQIPGGPRISCREAPGADNVMILLKTGATEVYQKLPAHFVTTFKCIPHFMVFSDLEQSFADYPVYDAMESISNHYRDHHEDFELYRKLAQYKREGQDVAKLKGMDSWNLDKWKFLPMMHKAFSEAGDNIQWFVIIEADTSVSWTNLLQFLRRLDPSKPYYMGSQNFIGTTEFAHGGSGIIFSRKTADLLEELREKQGRKAYDEKWEELTSIACCGDEVIARSLKEVDVGLTVAWPPIQGETISTLDWTNRHWCMPAITWHHVAGLEIDRLWQFDSYWVDGHGWNEPYLFRDVFEYFVEKHVSVNRTKWNNLSADRRFATARIATADEENYAKLQDYEKRAVESEEACAEACLRKPEKECVQWMYSPGRCYLGKDIRLGRSSEHETDHWNSGWIQERIRNLKDRHAGCQVRWPQI